MLYVTWLLFQGSLTQAQINADVQAPVTGASVAIFYASGVFFSVSAALLLLRELLRTVTGKVTDEELVMVQESEDLAALHDLHLDQPANFDGKQPAQAAPQR
jgi:TRAP-type C4-dicarboxylate transport system permease small subunit